MRISKRLLILLAMVVVLSNTTHAKERSLNPWIDCGIGALIFPEMKGIAAISNITWDLGTTAVTSGISSKDTCNGSRVTAALFIKDTYANLAEETAIGEGEHMTAMLNILGCDTTQHTNISNSIRSKFAGTIGNAEYTQKTNNQQAQDYFAIVDATVSGEFSQSCQAI